MTVGQSQWVTAAGRRLPSTASSLSNSLGEFLSIVLASCRFFFKSSQRLEGTFLEIAKFHPPYKWCSQTLLSLSANICFEMLWIKSYRKNLQKLLQSTKAVKYLLWDALVHQLNSSLTVNKWQFNKHFGNWGWSERLTWFLAYAGMKNIFTQKGESWLLSWKKAIEAWGKGTSKHGQDMQYPSTATDFSGTAPELRVKPTVKCFPGFVLYLAQIFEAWFQRYGSFF